MSSRTPKTQTPKDRISKFISYMRTFALFNALYCGCRDTVRRASFERNALNEVMPVAEPAFTSLVFFYLGTTLLNTIAITTAMAGVKFILLVQSIFLFLAWLNSVNCESGLLWFAEVALNMFFNLAYFNAVALRALLMSPAFTGCALYSNLCYINCLVPACLFTLRALFVCVDEFAGSCRDNFSSYCPDKDMEDSQNAASASLSSTFTPAGKPVSEPNRSNASPERSRSIFFSFSLGKSGCCPDASPADTAEKMHDNSAQR